MGIGAYSPALFNPVFVLLLQLSYCYPIIPFIYSDNDKTCLQMMKMMKLMKMMKVMRMRWINTRGDAGGNERGSLV